MPEFIESNSLVNLPPAVKRTKPMNLLTRFWAEKQRNYSLAKTPDFLKKFKKYHKTNRIYSAGGLEKITKLFVSAKTLFFSNSASFSFSFFTCPFPKTNQIQPFLPCTCLPSPLTPILYSLFSIP